MGHEGDALRGLVIRYRAAYEEYDAASAHVRGEHQSPKERMAASERVGAAARMKISLEEEILKRLREGGAEVNAMLLRYHEETGR